MPDDSVRNLFRLLFAAWLLAGVSLARAEPPPLSFGIFPKMPARQLIETYQPLARALEKSLNRRVVIHSARDFRTFAQRTAGGEYDLLLTAPHLAWLAQKDAGYRPLLKYATPIQGLLVVRADSPHRSPESLKGRTLARADALAISALAAQVELAAHGLRAGVDYHVTEAGTHTNAAMQVIQQRAEAAALGLHTYRLLAPELRAQLRVLLESPPLSSKMFLAHPRLRDGDVQALRNAMLAFAATPEGQAFMARSGFGGFAPVDGEDLRAFQPHALEAQRLLRNAP